jgi:hypothetical protein
MNIERRFLEVEVDTISSGDSLEARRWNIDTVKIAIEEREDADNCKLVGINVDTKTVMLQIEE